MTRKAAFRSNQPQRDHIRPRGTIVPTTEELDAHLTELIAPATFALVARFHGLGLRERILTLPVMTALLLTMIWRQVEGVASLVTLLERRGLLWTGPRRVSQQAVAQRLQSLPATLFVELFNTLAPVFQARAAARSRPLPPVVERARQHYSAILAADGTTLEALFHKVGALRGSTKTVLAGRVLALLDVVSKQPLALFREESAVGNDHQFQARLLRCIPPGALILLDAGFYDFRFFAALSAGSVAFIVRGKTTLAGTVVETLLDRPKVRDRLVRIGAQSRPAALQVIRVVDVQVGGTWRRYLTNVLDPAVLSVQDVVDLYALRWRVEDAFLQVKRLLNLSYLPTGGENGIQLQIWATWLLYGVLVDLCDAVAEELDLPLERISIEMVYRAIPFYCEAYQAGETTSIVSYIASLDRLGIVKRLRTHRIKPPIDLSETLIL